MGFFGATREVIYPPSLERGRRSSFTRASFQLTEIFANWAQSCQLRLKGRRKVIVDGRENLPSRARRAPPGDRLPCLRSLRAWPHPIRTHSPMHSLSRYDRSLDCRYRTSVGFLNLSHGIGTLSPLLDIATRNQGESAHDCVYPPI